MKTYIIASLKLCILTLLLFGVIYPIVITVIAKILDPAGGDGRTVKFEGKNVGFELIGQSFRSAQYFNSRPSAVDYNAAATGGSNKGPTNPDYLAQVRRRIENLLKENPAVKPDDIPIDLVTASGSGLDPHISSQAAALQIRRIAKARGLSEDALDSLVKEHLDEPLSGLLGPTRVHVLKLNIALDELSRRENVPKRAKDVMKY